MLSIDLEHQNLQSCCSAFPDKINTSWLQQNPGKMFNSPMLQNERQDMLNNLPVASCEDTCWKSERNNIPSRRIIMKSDLITHTSINAVPEVLHINLGSDCNLTCVYCTKQYSKAWLKDVDTNGVYFDDDRFNITPVDSIVLKLGQNKIKSSQSYQLILEEARNYKSLKEVLITGGEPFLYNGLSELLNNLDCETPIKVFTGLGVNTNRLQNILNQITNNNIEFVVSAETTGNLYEFIRYGNSYNKFLRNFEILEKSFNVSLSVVLSNLTIHGLPKFENDFGKYKRHHTIFCTSPDYLNVNVLDKISKKNLEQFNFNFLDKEIKQTLQVEYTSDAKNKLKLFLHEYARRRNLSLKVLPESFVQWITE